MPKCNHGQPQDCAWAHAAYHPHHDQDKNYGRCNKCGQVMAKSSYHRLLTDVAGAWTIEYLDHDFENWTCTNLLALHVDCSQPIVEDKKIGYKWDE